MQGFITKKHVFVYFSLIWREFGFKAALRCIWAVIVNKKTTFLDEVMRD